MTADDVTNVNFGLCSGLRAEDINLNCFGKFRFRPKNFRGFGLEIYTLYAGSSEYAGG